MVLVALVGMGLGMYQLFHLQKELAELREVSLAHGLIGPRVPGCNMPLLRGSRDLLWPMWAIALLAMIWAFGCWFVFNGKDRFNSLYFRK